MCTLSRNAEGGSMQKLVLGLIALLIGSLMQHIRCDHVTAFDSSHIDDPPSLLVSASLLLHPTPS
jgi:hypothetical protein